MLFTHEIWLDEPKFCNECPCHDDTGENPRCKDGDFYMRSERFGKEGAYYWLTPRPRGCNLKPVKEEPIALLGNGDCHE